MALNKTIFTKAKLHPDPLSSGSSHDTVFEAMGRVRNVADQVRMHTLLVGGLRKVVLVLFMCGIVAFLVCANLSHCLSLS
jgi:hypothetical protein